jgi:hypothetical protein
MFKARDGSGARARVRVSVRSIAQIRARVVVRIKMRAMVKSVQAIYLGFGLVVGLGIMLD